MVDIQARSLAIGNIFEYAESVSRQEVVDWAENHDLEPQGQQNTLNFGPGVEIAGKSIKVAGTDRLSLLFHPDANIDHWDGQCTFVTVKDEQGADFDTVIDYTNSLIEEFEDIGVIDQLAFHELTLEGRVRVSSEHDINAFFDSEVITPLQEKLDSPIGASAARFTSGKVENQPDYTKFLVDAEALNNPRFWQFKYVRRYNDPSEISEERVAQEISDIIESSKNDE